MSENVQIAIEVKGLETLKKALKQAPELVGKEVQKALSLATTKTQASARKEAPVRTGNLRRHIDFTLKPFKGIVESKAEYGIYVHQGTRPHIITPSKKKALYWKEAPHPVKSVRHPGTKANPFMERGAKGVEGEVNAIFQSAVKNITSKLAK